MVGLMGWFVPQVLGVGYGFVGEALNGRMAFQLMALLVVLKLIAVTTSYATGNAAKSSGHRYSLAPCWAGASEHSRIPYFRHIRRHPELTR